MYVYTHRERERYTYMCLHSHAKVPAPISALRAHKVTAGRLSSSQGERLQTRNHKVKFHWTMPLKVHLKRPLKIHDDF